jgi:poly(hydroxyalkanoate) granule-associated protein
LTNGDFRKITFVEEECRMGVFETARKIMLAGVGALALTEEKLESVVQELIKKGELTEEEGKKTLAELREKISQNKRALQDQIQQNIDKALKKMGYASREEVKGLEQRIEGLEAQLKAKEK